MWKHFAALLAVAFLAGEPAAAQQNEGPVKLGVLTDMSSTYAELSGAGSVEAARIAIEEVGGKVLGRDVELLFADHQQKPDIGLGIAREWFDQRGVDVILDVPNSAIALAVASLTKEKKRLAIFAAAATDRLTEDACTGSGLHWTFDTYSQTNAAVRAIIERGADTWFLLTADYAYGHSMQDAMQQAIAAAGGKVVGSVRFPLGTADFSSFLLQAQASKAKMISVISGGSDTVNAIKQAREFGVFEMGQHVSNPMVYITDVHSVGLTQMAGMQFVVTWYWDHDERSRAFGKKFFDRLGKMPGEAQAGVYSAVLQYLKAVEAVGSKDPEKVLTKLQATKFDDTFAVNGKLLPNGRMIHDKYLVQVKSPEESKYPWDYYKILSVIPAEKAFRPLSESKCPLLKK